MVFRTLLDGPASAIFLGARTDMRLFHVSHDVSAGQARAEIDSFRPHFVLVGLSGGGGVDEALLGQAQRIGVPTGAIQDYWGFLGPVGADRLPDVYFVIDRRAKELTLARAAGRVRAEITGSPRHERYQGRLAAWLGSGPSMDRTPQVAFYMQPSQIPGMLENLAAFVDAMQQIPQAVRICIRQHPAERDPERVLDLAASGGVLVDVTPAAGEIEAELAKQDVICTCFSSAGLDHNYLQLYAPRPLGALAYLAIGDDIRASMREFIGTDVVPGAEGGMGVQIDEEERLRSWIASALSSPQERNRYHQAVRGNLRSPTAAAHRIEQVIRQMLGVRKCTNR